MATASRMGASDPFGGIRFGTDPFGTGLADLLGAAFGPRPDPRAGEALAHLCAFGIDIPAGEAWTAATLRWLEGRDGEHRSAEALVELSRLILQHLGRDTPGPAEWRQDHVRYVPMLRASAWVIALSSEPRAEVVVGDLIIVCGTGRDGNGDARCLPVARSAVAALEARLLRRGHRADDADPVIDPAASRVVAQLLRAHREVSNRKLRAELEQATGAVARHLGTTPERLRTAVVEDFGLDPEGNRELRIGQHRVRLRLVHDPSAAYLEIGWLTGTGQWSESAPPAAELDHQAQLVRLRKTAQRAKKALAAQRRRLERHLSEEHVFRAGGWATDYLDHPVVGLHARNLVWQVRSPDGGPWFSGLPHPTGSVASRGRSLGWALHDPDGASRPLEDGDLLRLWHPVRHADREVQRWRNYVWHNKIHQPCPQAFRDRHRPGRATDGTTGGVTVTAGHLLRPLQAAAMLRHLEWRVTLPGASPGWAERDLGGRWRMRMGLEPFLPDDGEPALWRTGAMEATRLVGAAGGDGVPVAPTDLPPVPFSEFLREVTHLVAATGVAADPSWAARGGPAVTGYWWRITDGELDEPARTRRDVLARLLPELPVADRTRLAGSMVQVSGRLMDYLVHIGTGVVLAGPDRRPSPTVRRPRRGDVYLPMEHDGPLDRLLATVAMLGSGDGPAAESDHRTVLGHQPGRQAGGL